MEKKNVNESDLLEQIAKWPDWKLQAMCLDESDLKIIELIRKYQESMKEYQVSKVKQTNTREQQAVRSLEDNLKGLKMCSEFVDELGDSNFDCRDLLMRDSLYYLTKQSGTKNQHIDR